MYRYWLKRHFQILIGISSSKLVALLALSTYSHHSLAIQYLFQTITISLRSSPLRAIACTKPTAIYLILSTACFRRKKKVDDCPLWKNGKLTCSRILPFSSQLKKNTSLRGHFYILLWIKCPSITSETISSVVVVVSLRTSPVLHCRASRRAPNWSWESAVSVLRQ